jgi:hypothetical protein
MYYTCMHAHEYMPHVDMYIYIYIYRTYICMYVSMYINVYIYIIFLMTYLDELVKADPSSSASKLQIIARLGHRDMRRV